MNNPQELHHSLLRPCVLQILRATGYHSTRPSVLDAVTDLTSRYLTLLAQSTVTHASLNHSDPELALEISIQDVRMALQDCGALGPEMMLEEQESREIEDTRGVDEFIAWAMGPNAQEIRRIALDGTDEAKEDYLTVLKKKHSSTGDEESRYIGTVLGRDAEPRSVKIEGSEITNLKDWREAMQKSATYKAFDNESGRQSSVLSSLSDASIESMEL
ncbi:Transcription initiation factor TFIID subunit 3 [Erysiphe neolycopersici]|uniref:Transcription initiation factor TFIID subunit 3 n=1 Tax=Erysiphe neolycopersici TaxID=212602 RepID=A0A420HYZ9_9PEZI|nr:Transcription initiation factor TFIID subunit 3 [Erysiphe neolycopersici]